MALKVLVTGAAGSIGLPLSRRLLDRGDSVTLLDNFSKSRPDSSFLELLERPGARLLEGNLANPTWAQRMVLPDFDLVFHAAALNGTGNFYSRSFDVLENSSLPTVSILKALGDGFDGRFIYFGSSESYASGVSLGFTAVPTPEEVPLVIDNILNPRWSYAASKLHGEVATVAAGNSFGMEWAIARVHNSYGPRMGDNHVIPDFIARSLKGEYSLFGAKDTRSFAFVEDIVSALLLIAESKGCANSVINVGSDEEILILDLGKKILNLMGIEEEIAVFTGPEGSVSRRVPNIEKLRALGWSPTTTLDEGLMQTIEWIRIHGL